MFSDVDNIPFSLMNAVSKKIYDNSPSQSEEKRWCQVLATGMNTGVGYNYTSYNESKDFLNKNGRLNRLNKAFSTATIQCIELLMLSENNDYSKFSDRWNLDVGESKSPISSLTTIVINSWRKPIGLPVG